MPKVTKPRDGEDGAGSQGIWPKPVWPSGSPSVRIVMSGTWGGGRGMGGGPARALDPWQPQGHRHPVLPQEVEATPIQPIQEVPMGSDSHTQQKHTLPGSRSSQSPEPQPPPGL